MVDLRSHLPGVRDQGERYTCLSLALTDGHQVARRNGIVLAADYLHFHAAKGSGVGINDAVGVPAAMNALQVEGQPNETACPYSRGSRANDWRPPAIVGEVWKCVTAENRIDPWKTLVGQLGSGSAAVIVIAIDEAFQSPSGGVVESAAGPVIGSHAVLVVGTSEDPKRVLVRNSWGRQWGADGHGWLSESYLAARCKSIITFGAPS